MALGLAIYDGITVLPQLLRTIATRDLSGLSLLSWALRILTTSGWIAYAAGIGHLEAAGWAFFMLPVALIIFTRVLIDRLRQRSRAAAAHCSTATAQTSP